METQAEFMETPSADFRSENSHAEGGEPTGVLEAAPISRRPRRLTKQELAMEYETFLKLLDEGFSRDAIQACMGISPKKMMESLLKALDSGHSSNTATSFVCLSTELSDGFCKAFGVLGAHFIFFTKNEEGLFSISSETVQTVQDCYGIVLR